MQSNKDKVKTKLNETYCSFLAVVANKSHHPRLLLANPHRRVLNIRNIFVTIGLKVISERWLVSKMKLIHGTFLLL